jgi:eukaryotic-like serine/threonine-protein kinase
MEIKAADASAARPDPLAGTAYRTRSYLGHGSMGVVVEAEHVTLGTVVVVKLIRPELATRHDAVDRMRIEAQAMARLSSPHLTRCTDLGATPDGRPFLVLERLYGRTVADELGERGALPPEEAIDIARQTLSGLAVVHRAGMVHRDIKPSNLFLCRGQDGGRLVKILDFGIAKVIDPGQDGGAPEPLRFPTAEGAAVGTPRSLSPEQARGLPVDARTDLYAVGVLLYALLTGKGPFDDICGIFNVMTAQLTLMPPPPSRRAPRPLPPELDAIVLRALAKSMDDRFASAAELSLALARARFDAPGVPSRFDTVPLRDAGSRRAVAPPAPASCTRFGTEVMPRAPELPGVPPSVSLVATAHRASPARARHVLALVALIGALSFVSFAAWFIRAWIHR